MFGRAARLLLRLAGWLLTPLVITVMAGLGAIIGLMIAPSLSPNLGLLLTVALGFAAAVLGLVFWVKLLRRNPGVARGAGGHI